MKRTMPGDGAPESDQQENGRIWLNTVNAVDHIIRDFTNEIFALLGREDFMPRLDFECRRMNNLFLNVTPSDRYQRGEWNSPGALGEHVLKVLRISGEPRLAVRDVFTIYTAALLSVADQDAEFDPATIEPLIGNLRNALLGLEGAVPFRAM